MPVADSHAGGMKQLSEQQRSAAASLTPSAADRQSKRPTASKPSTSNSAAVFPDADNLPSTYAAFSSTTAAAGGTGPSTQQQEAADAALYRDMRSALADFESQQQKLPCSHASTAAAGQAKRPARMPPRQTAFYAALRSVLQQVLTEATPAGRHTRLLAAHVWYVGHRPRPVAADAGLAAAMAASLSISTPAQQQRVGSPQSRGVCSRPHPPGLGVGELGWDSDSCCSDSAAADAACTDQRQSSYAAAAATAAAATATAGGALRPSSAVHAQRLDAAARSAFVNSWPYSNGSSSSGGWGGSSGAADVPGLIPVGTLPSSRFTSCLPPYRPTSAVAAAAAAAAAARTSVTAAAGALSASRICSTAFFREPHEEQQQQQQQQQRHYVGTSAWSAVMTQQAALEAEVADSMRGFARQRARIEEDISRRQELAAVAAATAAGSGQASSAAAGAAAGASDGRVLQHMDSQHQPSQVTAELALTACGRMAGIILAGNAASSNDGSSGVQLVVPDKVKAARKQHQQEGAQEVAALQESMGLPDSVLARALLPPPDIPYMSAFAQLPRYTPPAKAAAPKKMRKNGKGEKGSSSAKRKGGKGSSGKAGKAVKS